MENLLKSAYPYIANRCKIAEINEIRIRLGQKLLVKTKKEEIYIPYIADEKYIESVIDVATNYSRYAYEETISSGYIDYVGGIRIGLVGEGWVNGSGKNIYRKYYALCIRIPHLITYFPDIPNEIFERFDNTLIVSPPGCGKTTLLREFAYRLSDKHDLLLIDERGEICGKNLIMSPGKRCDVIQGIPKEWIYETAIRTMAPEIVACDELFGEKDYIAIKSLIGAGIKVVATLHGEEWYEGKTAELFPVKIYLSSIPTVGSIKSIVMR